jgi:hypothetical protein
MLPSARCTRFMPGVMCDARREAMQRGEMFFCALRLAWLYPAEDRKVPKAMRDAHHMPYQWSFCPFCGGQLPDLVDGVTRALTEPPPGDDGPE